MWVDIASRENVPTTGKWRVVGGWVRGGNSVWGGEEADSLGGEIYVLSSLVLLEIGDG